MDEQTDFKANPFKDPECETQEKTPILSPKNPRKPKKIKKKNLGKTKTDLKRRARIIAKELIKGSRAVKALEKAGYSRNYALTSSTEILKNPVIQRTFKKILDDAGLDDEALAAKIAQLCVAKETKFFSEKGMVIDEREVEALSIQADMIKHVTKLKGYVTDKTSVEAPGIEELLRELRAKRQE